MRPCKYCGLETDTDGSNYNFSLFLLQTFNEKTKRRMSISDARYILERFQMLDKCHCLGLSFTKTAQPVSKAPLVTFGDDVGDSYIQTKLDQHL